MLILTLVCVAWLEIIGIQSAKKEARRREAVERLAGMMDAFMELKQKPSDGITKNCAYYLQGLFEDKYDRLLNCNLDFKPDSSSSRHFVFNEEISPIRYSLSVEEKNPLSAEKQSKDWKLSGKFCLWLVGRLYDNSDSDKRPFFTLPVCLGFPS